MIPADMKSKKPTVQATIPIAMLAYDRSVLCGISG
jgi:hypothetical protein